MKQLSARLLIALFFVIAFSFVVFLVAITFKNVQHTKEVNNKTALSLQSLMFTETLFESINDFNTAQWGYLFTSRQEYQFPYNKAEANLASLFDSLSVFQQQNQQQSTEIENVKRLLHKKIADSKHSLLLFDSAGMNVYVEKVKTGESKKINDSLSIFIKQLDNYNRTVLSNSNQYLEDLAQQTSYRFLLLSFIFCIILAIFLALIYVDFKRNDRTAAQLKYQASLIETLPDAIFTTNKDFIIESWNKYATELYGISVKDAIGKSLSSIMTVSNMNETKEASLKEIAKTGHYKGEYHITRKNDSPIYVMSSINTITNKDGDITGYIVVHRNITERKKLEDNQREFNLELARQVKIKTAETTNIMERITDGFLALDSNFTFTFVNKKAGEILGQNPVEMVGKNIFSDFNEIRSKQFNEACLNAFNSQHYIFYENFYEPLSRWLENDIYPSEDGLSIFFKDVTFKKKAELALKESEERYKHLIENIHAGVVVHHPNSSILLYNQEAARLLGIKDDKIIPAYKWYSVSANDNSIHPEEYPVFHVIKTGQPLINVTAGIDIPNTNERTWVLMNAFPEMDEEKKLKQVVLTFVDITDSKRAEEEIKRSENDLNMAQAIAKTGNWEFNLMTNDLKWSKELYRIYELEGIPSDKLYQTYRDRFHPEDLAGLDATVQKAIENKKGFTYQHRIIVNNGVVKHIMGIGEVVVNKLGQTIGIKGTGQDITGMVKAEEKLQNSYKQIKQLVTHLQDIREQERTNMAREIHDELGQQLTGIKMYLSWLNKKVTSTDIEIKEKFSATLQLIEDTIKSVRKISMDLRPSMLDDLGLMAALEWQSNEFEKRSGIATEFVNETGNNEIPAKLKTGLFRIYQESLTNVARHADANKITSSLKFEKDNLILTITDDGKGFTLRNIESKKTLGLFGMKERTLEMGGHYEIKSEPGIGTTVSVTIPVKPLLPH